MAQAVPLLLLLLLLLLIGCQGQEFRMKYQEQQTLRVNCTYKPRRLEKRWKIWCKEQKIGKCHNILIARHPDTTLYSLDQRAFLVDDTNTGIFTITMSKLQVEDSGIYWCVIKGYSDTFNVIRKIILDISPATTPKTIIRSQTITEMPFTTPAITLATSSPTDRQKFIIWGAVLASLLLLGLLIAGIVHTKKTSSKSGTGDDDINEDFENQKQKTRDVTMEMQEEDYEVIQYASVIHSTQLSLGDSIYANTQMGQYPGLNHIPNEPVEYTNIARTRHQFSK